MRAAGTDDVEHAAADGDVVPVATARSSEASLPIRWPRESLWMLAAAAAAFVVAALSLRLWEWNPVDPIALGWDNTQISMQLKDIHDHGWYLHNPDIGYPFGQNGSWFPELNVLHVALVKLIDLVVGGSAFTAGGVYFVLCFPLTAVTAYLLARSQGLSPLAGFVAGVLLANAPGHAERYGHLYLAAYWVVPVALWLAIEVGRGRPMLSARRPGRPRWRGHRTLLTIAAVLVVGFSGVYYVAFTMVLVLAAALARRVVGSPIDLLRGLGVLAGLGSAIAIPLVMARVRTSGDLVTGRVPATRAPAESETYAGKLMDLLLPWPHHRVDVLELLSFVYNGTTKATVEVSALGFAGVAGLALLSGAGLLTLLAGYRPDPRLRLWSGLTLVSFLMYTVGGLGSLIAFFGMPQVRTWSRVSLYILALSLLALGWWLTRLERRRGVIVAGLTAALIAVVGALDQTNPDRAPDHAAVSAEMTQLRAYTRTIEGRVGQGCGVFQIPVLPYPETLGPVDMEGYDQLKPYLTESGLRFSFGAMRGTAAGDWMLGVDTSDIRALAEDLRSVGFCALEVDTQGFTPESDPSDRIQSALGAPIARTADGTFAAYDLRTVGAPGDGDTTRRAAVLAPVIATADTYAPEIVDRRLVQKVGPYAGISVANLGSDAVDVTLRMRVEAVGASPRTFTVKDGEKVVAAVTIEEGTPSEVAFAHRATPGRSTLTVEVSGPTEKEPGGDRVVTAILQDLTLEATTDVRGVAMLDQWRSGWVVP